MFDLQDHGQSQQSYGYLKFLISKVEVEVKADAEVKYN